MGGAKAKMGLSPRVSRENRCPPVKNKSDVFASYTGEQQQSCKVLQQQSRQRVCGLKSGTVKRFIVRGLKSESRRTQRETVDTWNQSEAELMEIQ